MKHERNVVIAAVIGLIILACIFGLLDYAGSGYVNFKQLKEHRETLLAFTREHHVLSSMIYICLYLATAFFMPGAIILTIAAGFLFGVIAGTLYIAVASVGGACLSFWLARRFFGYTLQDRYRQELEWLNREISRHGRYYLLVLRIVPVMPSFMVNYLAGLTRIGPWTFAWTTFLGVLPGSLVYTYAGRQLADIEKIGDIFSPGMLAAFAAMAVLSLVPVAFGHYRSRRNR